MSKLIIIEGVRNVGKSFLISKIDKPEKYKFMFSDYFVNSFIYDFDEATIECNDKKELHYFLLGTDISFLNLIKEKIINKDLIIDRGFISTLVFGIQANRITYKQALNQGKYILDKYGNNIKIILVSSEFKEDNRNKDMWSFYNQKETNDLYLKLLKDLNIEYVNFNNEFKEKNIEEFRNMF